MDYKNVFHLVADITKKAGVPCVLVGGFAINHYKVTRQTLDVDLLVTDDGYKKLKGDILKAGYKEENEQELCARFKASGLLMIDLDLIFVDGNTLDKMITNGNKVTIAGQKFVIPCILDLIAMKLHAIKNSKDRLYKDLPDIINLIKANALDSGTAEFKTVCERYGPSGIYERIWEALS